MTDYTDFKGLKVEKSEGVAVLTLNRPERLNAIDRTTHAELENVFILLNEDSDVRAVLITGAGRAFCAGGDIKGMAERVDTGSQTQSVIRSGGGKRLLQNILDLKVPLVAAVNGPAVGLGATIALFCDTVIMGESARIGDTHVSVGLVAGDGGAVIWPLLIGVSRAKYYLMTGELIPAPEAYRLGLVHQVVPDDELMETAMGLAHRLASGPTKAISYSKMAANKHITEALNLIIDSSLAWEHETFTSEDHAEAAHAFLEKRKPVFKGR